MLHLLRGLSDLFFQCQLRLLCILQTLSILNLTVIAFLQLGIRRVQRALILRDRCFLQRQLPLQRAQMRCKPGGCIFKVFNTGRCKAEIRLRFLDLLVDGFDIAGEVVRLKGQRHHKVTERLAHWFSPA